MNTLNILVVSADLLILDALTALVSRTNYFRAQVMQEEDARAAIIRMGKRTSLFDVIIATNDPKIDPCRLARFLDRGGCIDSLVIVETDATEPVTGGHFVPVGPYMRDGLLSGVRRIAASHHHS